MNELNLFPSSVYTIDKPEFLPIVKEVSAEYLNKSKTTVIHINETHPIHQTESFFDDPRLVDFSGFVGNTAWNILDSQGFDMKRFGLQFSEMWLHEHEKNSGMEQHVHGHGSQITGFYFVQCPKNSMRVIFYDPRPGKTQINLPERETTKATYASTMLNFEPQEGQFMFTNAWLPHSFTRNISDTPFQFVHFNLFVIPNNNSSAVEVV